MGQRAIVSVKGDGSSWCYSGISVAKFRDEHIAGFDQGQDLAANRRPRCLRERVVMVAVTIPASVSHPPRNDRTLDDLDLSSELILALTAVMDIDDLFSG